MTIVNLSAIPHCAWLLGVGVYVVLGVRLLFATVFPDSYAQLEDVEIQAWNVFGCFAVLAPLLDVGLCVLVGRVIRAVQVELGVLGPALRGREAPCLGSRRGTEREVAGARDRHHAYHDALTGLPNRLLFQDRLSQALRQAARSGGHAAVVFVDLDHFKRINDSFGHDIADLLLVDVAKRIQGALRDTDSVARQGGDEFLVLLSALSHPDHAKGLCEMLLDALRRPFWLDGREVSVTASVGVSVFPADGADATTLVKHADLAMYQSKQAGRDAVRWFSHAMHDEVVAVAGLRSRLARALERGELSLHYQPQVEVASGRLVGLEALLRWDSPEGSVSPSRFVPIAEECGLIVPIGEFVLRTACVQSQAWRALGLPDVRVAVNLSARQFQDCDLPALVRTVLRETQLPSHLLELEVTESIAMHDPAQARSVLEALKELGVTLALDDFGTGYSSLAYLRLFPFDRLKIDRSFLPHDGSSGGRACESNTSRGVGKPRATPAETGPSDVAIIDAIVAMAHALRLEVVAEGVETAPQLALLGGCDLVQGFGVCPPLTAEATGRLLARPASLLVSLRPCAPIALRSVQVAAFALATKPAHVPGLAVV